MISFGHEFLNTQDKCHSTNTFHQRLNHSHQRDQHGYQSKQKKKKINHQVTHVRKFHGPRKSEKFIKPKERKSRLTPLLERFVIAWMDQALLSFVGGKRLVIFHKANLKSFQIYISNLNLITWSLNVSHRIDGIKGPLMECNDMADKLTSSIFNELSYVYWLGLQGQLANLVVPDHLRISQYIYIYIYIEKIIRYSRSIINAYFLLSYK